MKGTYATTKTPFTCNYCGKVGHQQKECRNYIKDQFNKKDSNKRNNKEYSTTTSVITCPACKKPGHSIKTCFNENAKQAYFKKRRKNNYSSLATSQRNQSSENTERKDLIYGKPWSQLTREERIQWITERKAKDLCTFCTANHKTKECPKYDPEYGKKKKEEKIKKGENTK